MRRPPKCRVGTGNNDQRDRNPPGQHIDDDRPVGQVDVAASTAATGKTTYEGTVRVQRSLEHYTDLSLTYSGKIQIIGSPSEGMSMETTGPFEMTQRLTFENLPE